MLHRSRLPRNVVAAHKSLTAPARRVNEGAMAYKAQLDSGAHAAGGRFGRFYLKELLNRGGMADIWLVTDGSGKAFALRVMHARYRFNFMARRRFVQGCELLSRIHDHPNIVGYIEHGRAEGTLYLLMEYIEASNLKELHAQQDTLLQEHVAQILLD